MSRNLPTPIEVYCDAVYDMVKAKDRMKSNVGSEDAVLYRSTLEKDYKTSVKKVEEALQVMVSRMAPQPYDPHYNP